MAIENWGGDLGSQRQRGGTHVKSSYILRWRGIAGGIEEVEAVGPKCDDGGVAGGVAVAVAVVACVRCGSSLFSFGCGLEGIFRYRGLLRTHGLLV